jgi:hypothetical protein
MTDRIMAEADHRAAAARQAHRDYVNEVNDRHLSRGHVRPTERPVIGAGAAYIVLIAAAMVGGLVVWLLPPVFNAFFAWLVGWM